MKYLFSLLALVVFSSSIQSQELPGYFERHEEISVFETDSLFFLVVAKDGDQLSGMDTIELGDVYDANQFILDNQTRLVNKRTRLIRQLYDLDYGTFFDTYDDIIADLTSGQDSLRNYRMYNRVLTDTVSLIVPVSRIPVEDLADFTDDPSPSGTLTLEAVFFFNNSGVLRLENTSTGKSWKVDMHSKDNLEIGSFLGGKADFTRMSVVERTQFTRSVWRVSSEAAGQTGSVRIVVRKDSE